MPEQTQNQRPAPATSTPAAGTEQQSQSGGLREQPAATYAEGAARLRPGGAGAVDDGKPKGAAAAALGPRRVKEALNLRRAPGTKAPIQRVLPKAALVQAFDDRSDQDGTSWVYVQVGGVGGYVADRYLIEETAGPRDGQTPAAGAETAAQAPMPAPLGMRAVIGHLRLHEQAGMSAPVIAMLLRGSLVKIFDDRRKASGMTWILVDVDGTRGYVVENYLEEWTPPKAQDQQTDTGPSPAPPQTQHQPATTTPGPQRDATGDQHADTPTRGGAEGARMALVQAPLRKQPDDRTKTSIVVQRGATLELTGATVEKQAGNWTEVRYILDRETNLVETGWMKAGEVGAPDVQLASRYREMYEKATVNKTGPVTAGLMTREARLIIAHKEDYVPVSARTGLPWYVVGLIHMREASFNFKTYLHNGDPLGKPTTHVPKGINFDNWQDAAVDAIQRERDRFTKGILEGLEKYNGTGYRKQGTQSPYVWSGTTEYQKGKYASDGVYDPNLVDRQAGVAGVLKELEGLGVEVDHAAL